MGILLVLIIAAAVGVVRSSKTSALASAECARGQKECTDTSDVNCAITGHVYNERGKPVSGWHVGFARELNPLIVGVIKNTDRRGSYCLTTRDLGDLTGNPYVFEELQGQWIPVSTVVNGTIVPFATSTSPVDVYVEFPGESGTVDFTNRHI